MVHTCDVSVGDQVDRIVRPQPVAVRTVWPGEATHFTPWLSKNLDWLESLGLGPLELIGTEVALPTVGRALDILARTQDGRLVAIENQYLKVDHDHLTRGMAYAVGHQAQALIIIAEDHSAEFVAIADYLNKAYEGLGGDDGIAVFLVRLTVQQIGEAYVPQFVTVSRPNTWLVAVQAQAAGSTASIESFLDSCSSTFRDRAEQIVSAWNARSGGSIHVNPKSSSISLDFPYRPGRPAGSVYVLYSNGLLVVNRGYYIELGSLDDRHVEALDAALALHFPELSQKPYYPSIADADPVSVAAFADWLVELFANVPPGSVAPVPDVE